MLNIKDYILRAEETFTTVVCLLLILFILILFLISYRKDN
jgi:hypothetical protein